MSPRAAVASLSAAAILASVLPTPALALSPVNLSRYVVQRLVESTGTVDEVDAGRVQELCADEDGCALTLRLETSADLFHAVRLQLFYSSFLGDNPWTTETTTGHDGNGVVEEVAGFFFPAQVCILSDAELGGQDENHGFVLVSGSEGGVIVKCTLVIAD